MTRLRSLAETLFRFLRSFAVTLVGRWRWQPPAWLAFSARQIRRAWSFLRANPAYEVAAIVSVPLAAIAFNYYATRPRPHYVTYTVNVPGLTEYDEKGISSIKPLLVVFHESAAPLKQIQKPVTSGIEMSPAMPGTWTWLDDRRLQFSPRDDWPVDGAFDVTLARKGFAANDVRLDDYSFTFRSQSFSARVTESQFYQDPRDPSLKKLVATLRFSHPVDSEQLEQHISLAVAKDAEYLGLTPDSRHFTVAYDKFHLEAYVHSAALAMPRDDTPMTLTVDKGVRASRGGNGTANPLRAVVTIPGRTSLRFADARMTVVDNARYEPEQIVMLTSSSPVAERAFTGKITARLLPERQKDQDPADPRPYDWRGDEAQIGNDVLSASQAVNLTYVPSDEGGNTAHGFRFRAPVGRYVHVTVTDGVEGIGGYLSGKPYVSVLRVSPYRRKLTFLGQGALLSLSGDKKVGFLSRDVDRVQVEIGHVLPNQLQHIAPEMFNFSRPNLYGDMEDHLVERSVTIRDFSTTDPGKPTYDSIDIGQYLQDKSQARRGLFLLHLRALGRLQQFAYGEDDEDQDEDGVVEDTRLILVTDLGFIVKRAKDGSRDVFVQSIRSGLPVDAARIEVLGNNGLPVQTGTTDATGRAKLPPERWEEMQRDKSPQMVVAEKDDDFSFLPFNSNQRLDLSRFDTGGVENANSARQLTSYVFTDRGIYRPGETTHFGVITRTADWSPSLTGLPITLEINDPRGMVVSRSDLKLSATAFDEVTYATQPASPTGTYQATVYLVKDERRRETLGSTSFRVQEFEPDRLKVRMDLSDRPVQGWLTSDDVKAKVTVAHLFGEPATNRRVEGELSLTPVLPSFARYPDYRFQIGEVLTEPYQEKLSAATTDDTGVATLTLDLKRFIGRAYRLNVLARAFEAEGGRNVAVQTSTIVSDAPYLVGVRGDGDLSFVPRGSAHEARWIAVNQHLEPVATDTLNVEWVQRKFVSVLTQQDNRTFRYVSRLKEVVRDSRSIRIATGGSRSPLPTQEPGDFVLILRNAAGTELSRISYTVAGQANVSRSLERNTELQVQLDKPAYSGGDTMQVSIRAPYIGAGLITIERERVFHHQWFKTTTTSSVQKVTLPSDFEGNGYVTVQFLRDPASDELFMSPLSYGVAPFGPNLAARTQTITLTTPRIVKPGTTVTMHVAAGEASRVTVLAVDEGILQVARYKNPDPLGFFFQKRMLEVETRQILDLILPDFKRFLALAAPGGDADGGFSRHLNPFARKRKPAVAYWSGVVDVGRDGRDFRYTVPDYFNGRLRVVAISANGQRMGVSEAGTDVRGDFILTPNVPAMAAPGDEFLVSAGVFNNATGTGAVRVALEVGPALTVLGASTTDLQIEDKREGVAEFRVRANASLGSATLRFVARRGAAESRIEETVSVRPPVPYRTTLTLGRVDGSTGTAPVTRDLYAEQRKVNAAVASTPLVWGNSLVAYLDGYPYSCTEQLVSRGMSALVLLSRPEFGSVRSRDGQMLDSTFNVLRSRSNDQGGLGLWSSSPVTADFPTIYAAHFLVDAREHGQRVPADLLASLNGWLTRYASTPASSLAEGRLRAYAVYLLVRQGIKPNAAVSNVEQELTRRYAPAWTTDLAAAYLASSYRLMQRTADADRIIQAVPWSIQKRDWADDLYYDQISHDAQLLYLVSRHFPARMTSVPPAVLEGISTAVSANRVNSLGAAYTLLALDAFSKASMGTGRIGVAEVDRNGTTRALTLAPGTMPRINISEAAARVQFSKDGPLPAYFALDESGFDRNVPAGTVNSGIEIIREFVDAKNVVMTRFTVGDEFFVRLRVRSLQRDRVNQIALVDLLPGGVEPVLELAPPTDTSEAGVDPAMMRQTTAASALPIGVPSRSDWQPYHVDVREDRLVLYGDITRNASTFVYRVRANAAGTFQTPPAFAEGMYDRTISGLSPALKLEVAKP